MLRNGKLITIDGASRWSQEGRVRWFNDAFGYGFITHDDGQDVFVHHSAIDPDQEGHKTIKRGELVRYSVLPDGQGLRLRAARVERYKKCAQ